MMFYLNEIIVVFNVEVAARAGGCGVTADVALGSWNMVLGDIYTLYTFVQEILWCVCD